MAILIFLINCIFSNVDSKLVHFFNDQLFTLLCRFLMSFMCSDAPAKHNFHNFSRTISVKNSSSV